MKKVFFIAFCILWAFCFSRTGFAFELNVTANDSINVIACSDFQHPNGNDAGKTLVKTILSVMADDGITDADGFFCCGDYDYEYTETDKGVDALRTAVSEVVNENLVFTQGNHDSGIGTAGMSPSGNNDPSNGNYGVFVINEDDYMWYNNNEPIIKRTAQNLIDYMNEKISIGYDKPIFVTSHLPLHYNMRTKKDGDGMYANYIFDVLNEAGEKGLNIFFLYGHNHSNGWDDYLGGASVYLAKGDDILIAQSSQTVFSVQKLNFTYLNAGYVGYYNRVNDSDDALTMTNFKISDSKVDISRYDENGIHNLKSAGVTNSYKKETGYDPNTTVYESPQSVSLTSVTDFSKIDNLIEKPDVSDKDHYARITSANDLKDGGKYLLICNASDSYIMLPEVVEVDNRIGFNLEKTSEFGDDIVLGDYTEKEWTFTKSENGWLIGDGEKNAVFTNTSATKITATLEENGNLFAISGTADQFTFTSGEYVLNYNNSRKLINGYEKNPAAFSIYEYVEAEKPLTQTTINKTENGIECETFLNDVPVGTTIIMADYKEGCLICAEIRTVSSETTEHFTFTGTADTVKVFLLESIESLIPISKAEKISLYDE